MSDYRYTVKLAIEVNHDDYIYHKPSNTIIDLAALAAALNQDAISDKLVDTIDFDMKFECNVSYDDLVLLREHRTPNL